MQIQRDAFLKTIVDTTHLISPNEALFCSTHIKIVATEKSVRSYCSGEDISSCAYVPVDKENIVQGTYYFPRAGLEAFCAKLQTEYVDIERIDNRNILKADQRRMEFLDPKANHSWPRRPKSELENMDTLSENDAFMIQSVAQTAGQDARNTPTEYHCVYATPTADGTEIYSYNGLALSMGVLDKKLKRAVALPVPLSRMAKFGNLLVSDKEMGIEGPYCLYWCDAPVRAQKAFPLHRVQDTLNKGGEKLFEIDGKDTSAMVDLLQRAFGSWDEASDAMLLLNGDRLMVRVKFPSTKFEEILDVRGSGIKDRFQLALRDHAKLLPVLAKQPVLKVYNVEGRSLRFEGDGYKLLLPLERP